MNSFGHILSAERKSRGVSQHRLATDVQTTQRHLSFLETGRSKPSREMIIRLSEAMQLSHNQRGELFEAAGFTSPYSQRNLDSKSIRQTIELMEKYVLANWPYPGLILDPEMNILSFNQSAKSLFMLPNTSDAPMNVYDALLSNGFMERVQNWEELSWAVYLRLRRQAQKHPQFRQKLESYEAAGLFDDAIKRLAHSSEVPPFIPIMMEFEDGTRLQFTSIEAGLSTVHDDILSGITIELVLPINEESDKLMRNQP
jgi:transcriptional regulator with XRE-family HTH domain